MEEKFKSLINNKNADLWKSLDKKYHINVCEGKEPGYLSNFTDEEVRIEVNINDISPASFTHELLHIYLKYKNVLIASDLKEMVEKNEKLNRLFSDSLKTHLGNCLEHTKMLPLYLERGFNNKDFVRDYNDKIMEEEELKNLQKNYKKKGAYNRDSVDKFIGKFFSMKTSNNPTFNYDVFFVGLKELDFSLYNILDQFWKNWLNFKIGEPSERYQKMLAEFEKNLLKWIDNKVVV